MYSEPEVECQSRKKANRKEVGCRDKRSAMQRNDAQEERDTVARESDRVCSGGRHQTTKALLRVCGAAAWAALYLQPT